MHREFGDEPTPKIRITDNRSLLDRICLTLAEKGWCGGHPEKVAEMSISWTVKILNDIDFRNNYRAELKAKLDYENTILRK